MGLSLSTKRLGTMLGRPERRAAENAGNMIWATAMVLGGLLVLTGCDDDDDIPVDSGIDAGGGNTIAAIVAADPDYSMLVAAATRADLVGTLGSGELTLFAPDNAAFAASGITTEMIETMPVADLRGLLTYHAVMGMVMSANIQSGPVITQSTQSIILGNGTGVTINGGNTVAGGADVTTADIEASNGVIHAIDRVLLPPTVADLTRYAGLTTLTGALTTAGLTDDLAGTGPFTVFAPTNEAFAALPAVPTGDELTSVLLYHVVGARVTAASVPARASSLSENAYGDFLTLLFDTSDGVIINNGPRVVVADVFATNGVVHIVDQVIIPMNVVGAANVAGLTGLLGAVGAAADLPDGTSIAEALQAQAPYTVFAPSNEAFTAASTVIAGLSATQVRDVLLFHVLDTTTFPSPVLAAELPTAATELDTLNPVTTNTVSFAPGPPPTVEGAGIVSTDLVVTNGVIHVIDAVMVPPTL